MGLKLRGNLFIVSAPSGAGKTSLCQKLTADMSNIRHSVSFTTRKSRRGEVNDLDYTFVNENEFQRMVEAGEFAEWARVHGNLYGTSRKRLEALRDEGLHVILDIDTQGAKEIRSSYHDGIYIFILPPSLDDLKERLEKRMSNSAEEIVLRLKRAVEEIKNYAWYDYVIINNKFDEALAEMKAIVVAEDRRTGKIDPQWVKENFRI
ncbi:MAG TPA: guanylate kinase [Thermodesulfovibrionales bacterium]|nr:guanylate kinase [Thermodesulfovibrionales bacterium]